MTRNPAAVSAGIWLRHMYEESGKPCSSRTGSASGGPSSTTWNERPLASIRVPGRVSSALLVDVGEPARVPVDVTASRREERLLDLLGDRPAPVGDHGAVVDLLDRAHLGGGPGEEGLVRGVQVGSDQFALPDLVAEVAHDRDHGLPGDAVEAPRRQRRGGD